MGQLWDSLLDLFRQGLDALEGAFEPVFGAHAWGWAIIALTLIVRILLLPLAIKQTHSMRGMQAIQPKVKAIQKKYKADRELMRKDPQAYRERRNKMNEEVMALYREHGVNPASGCLPLLLQMPIFFALFRILQGESQVKDKCFYFFTGSVGSSATCDPGLGARVGDVGVAGIALLVLMAGSMFWSQRQMQARQDAAPASQQKILMYVMPLFLGIIGVNFPLGVLLYWVTTNFWQMAQQAVILREVKAHPGTPESSGKSSQGGKSGRGNKGSKGGGKPALPGKGPAEKSGKSEAEPGPGRGPGTSGHENQRPAKGQGTGKSKSAEKRRRAAEDHLPRRPSSDESE